VGCRATE
jgi:hypothetical protein